MKTSTIKSLLVTLALMLVVSQSYSQNYVVTRIDVSGTRYTDQMWVFSISSCSRGYDNGWDGYKMLGPSVAPQIMAMEESGYYQVDAVPDINNTVIAFKAGEDSQYTFTFANDNLNLKYEHLYIIDLVANDTIDVTATGSKYTFNVEPTAVPVKRFILITSLPAASVPPTPAVPIVVPEEPIVVDVPPTPAVPVVFPEEQIVVVVPPTPSVVEIPVVDPIVVPVIDNNKKDKKGNNIKITNSNRMIAIENQSNNKGNVSIVNAMTGRKVKETQFKSNGITNFETDVPAGTYVINATTATDKISSKIVIN